MKKFNPLFFKAILAVIITLATQSSLLAQSGIITGTINDTSGAPLGGVTVLVKNGNAHDISRVNGNYSIKAHNGETLVFSFIGYQTQEVKVNSPNMDIEMIPVAASASNAVVVTAYGIKRDTKSLGYSVTTVSGDAITRTNTINPITALQGKVAGVEINVMSSSGVQSSPYIQIRGAKVLGNGISGQVANNQPIFVVDGNIINNNMSSPDGSDAGSQLKNLNPDDYESITVLKGAAATALYGSRGINGAVVITTKSGKMGQGLGIEYSTTYSSTDVYAPFMKLQNEFGMGSYNREGSFAPDGTQTITPSNWGPAFDGTKHPAPYNTDTLVPYVSQPDNWKTFFRNGSYVNNNLTLSGGGDKYNYRLSYSNTHDAGILPNNSLNRNAIDMKMRGELNKIFSVEMGINYANTITKNIYNQSRYAWPGGGNLGFDVYYVPRNTNLADWYATYRNPNNTVKGNQLGSIGNAVTSGFSSIDKNNYALTENSLLAYLQLKAQVLSWLDFSAKGNVNYLSHFGETKNLGNGVNNTGGYYSVSSDNSTNYDLLFMVHANKKAINNNLNIDFRLMNEEYGNMRGQSYNVATNGGLKVPNQFFIGNSINLPIYGNQTSFTYGYPNQFTVGIAGDLNLSYKNYLNLEATARNDWLSTLAYPSNVPGANNYSVFYPSIDASYSFYDHLQDKMPSWLSSGRIRASYAEVGNAGIAGAYTLSQGYTPSIILDQNGNNVPSASFYNGNIRPNYDLKPQISHSVELGTNFGLFKEMVNVDLAWYKTNTFNQLLFVPGVIETGYTRLYLNAGNLQNTGIELLINVNPIRTKDWNLDWSFNFTHNHGKAIELYNAGGGLPSINSWNLTGNYEGAYVQTTKGGDIGDLYVQSQTAFQIDPKTGYPIIETTPRAVNSNPANQYSFANYQYVYDTADVNMGNIEPKFFAGTNFTLRYKNFSLFAQVDGRFGGVVYSESYTYAMGNGTPLSSLQFRDKAHGGVARTDSYTGQTVYDGAVPNAVFAMGQVSPINGQNIGGMTFKDAYQKGLVESWYAPAYYDGGPGYNGTYDWENGLNYNGAVTKETWVMLREITFGYSLPSEWVAKTHFLRGATLSVSARNIGYLYNSLPDGQNPASVGSNDPNSPYITGGIPFSRNYSVTLNVKF